MTMPKSLVVLVANNDKVLKSTNNIRCLAVSQSLTLAAAESYLFLRRNNLYTTTAT